MKKILLILFLLLKIPAFAALPDYTVVWEVRTSGNDTNGGGFVTGSSGTDMSQFNNKNATSCTSCQSATVNISVTDAVTTNTTSVVSITANFSSALIGNIIYMTGSGINAGWYQVISVTNSTTIVVDRSQGSGGTGGTINIGGALATLSTVDLNMQLTNGPSAWVKADGTYAPTATVNFVISGPNHGNVTISGYTSTRGDAGKPLVQVASGFAGNSNAYIFGAGFGTGTYVSNFTLDCNSAVFTRGMDFGGYAIANNITVENCSDNGFAFFADGVCIDCTTINTPRGGTGLGQSSTNVDFFNNNFNIFCVNCKALGSTVNGAIAFSAPNGIYVNPIVANFTGTTTHAFAVTVQEATGLTVLNASIYNITGDAFRYGENQGIDSRQLIIRNAVMSGIGGYCFNVTGTLVLYGAPFSDHNFCNTTGATGFYNGWPAGVGDVTLTGNPFTNGGSNNFALNNTAGAGAAVRGAGNPSYLDGGALQHQDAGGSSVTVGRPIR